MKRFALGIAIAAAAVMAGTALTLADEAVVTRDSDVYRNRTGNDVIYRVDEDEIVEVLRCRSNRCEIEVEGRRRNGWIRQNRLAPLDEDGDARRDIPFRFGITIGPGGTGVSIGTY